MGGRQRVSAQLFFPEAGVDAVEGDELGVGAALGDGTVVEDDDLVGVGDGGEAVCDVDGGASGSDAGKGVLDLALASR